MSKIMPFVKICKTEDNKWHICDCHLLKDNKIIEEQIIGSLATKPQPIKEDLCRVCFNFMFKSK